jgi:hypothetical protein
MPTQVLDTTEHVYKTSDIVPIRQGRQNPSVVDTLSILNSCLLQKVAYMARGFMGHGLSNPQMTWETQIKSKLRYKPFSNQMGFCPSEGALRLRL